MNENQSLVVYLDFVLGVREGGLLAEERKLAHHAVVHVVAVEVFVVQEESHLVVQVFDLRPLQIDLE